MNVKRIYFSFFVISIFLLSPLNQVVSASTIEVEKTLRIDSANLSDYVDGVDYASRLNLVNKTNVKYTNYEQLISKFEMESGVTGGFSGSFLPPAMVQLSGGETQTENNKLHLVSFVEFTRKNLLSGASISWWRCPYYYDASIDDETYWNLDLSIYYTGMPRKENLSFEFASNPANNYPVVPTDYGHPSLVFRKQYTNCGFTKDNEQFNISSVMDIPANDTLTDPKLPYNETTNPYKYWESIRYSHTWFNITAPIYPNTSYMVVWSIETPVSHPTTHAGSFWITSTDVGNNYWGRSLVCFNNRTTYELPIDLDSSVIFVNGLGDGVSGVKLQQGVSNYYPHNLESFEESGGNMFSSDFVYNFTSAMGGNWVIGTTTNGYPFWNHPDECVDFNATDTDGISGIKNAFTPIANTGYNLRLEVDMQGVQYQNPYLGGTCTSSSLRIDMVDTTNYFMYQFRIVRRKWLSSDGKTFYDNFFRYATGISSFQEVYLPDNLPNSLYITIINDNTGSYGTMKLYIYEKGITTTPIFTWEVGDVYNSRLNTDMGYYYYFYGGAFDGASDRRDGLYDFAGNGWGFWQTAVKLKHLTTTVPNYGLSWSVGTSGTSETMGVGAFSYLYNKYETSLPDYNQMSNRKSFIFPSQSDLSHSIYIEKTIPLVGVTNKVLFVSGKYKLQPDTYTESIFNISDTEDSYCLLQVRAYNSGGGLLDSNMRVVRAWDNTWHDLSIDVSSIFTISYIVIRVTAVYGISKIPLLFTLFYHSAKTIEVDGFLIESYALNTPHYRFYQKVDTNSFNDTNFYTLMIPFKYESTFDRAYTPLAEIRFRNELGITVDLFRTSPSNFYKEFIMFSIKSKDINLWNTVYDVRVDLYNYVSGAYLFLWDKNNNFDFNTKNEYKYNSFEVCDSIGIVTNTYFMSPYYSFVTTDGELSNAESQFVIDTFYFVVVYFVRFNDNDFEVLSIKFDEVSVEDFEAFRFELKSFGSVYTAEEWLVYLEFKNRPTFIDMIVDAFCNFVKWFAENTFIGKMLYAIGKFIVEGIKFIAPYLEALANFILEAFVFIVSVVIYFLATWIMWNFTKFWILIGQNKPQEALAELTKFTSQVQSYATSGVKTAGKILPFVAKGEERR